jgi:hypothetical protein
MFLYRYGRQDAAGNGVERYSRHSCSSCRVDWNINGQMFLQKTNYRPPFIIIPSFVSYAPDPTSPLKPHRATMPTQSKVSKQSKPFQAVPSRSSQPDTPPDSPTWPFNFKELAKEFFDTVKRIQESESKEASPFAGPQVEGNTEPVEARARASRLEFRAVDEVYVP